MIPQIKALFRPWFLSHSLVQTSAVVFFFCFFNFLGVEAFQNNNVMCTVPESLTTWITYMSYCP